ncbi:hypothetical protein HHL19_34390 [Streptomyces sp. R302]|uniref:hypothetical protein n=1 Tax=unclassified Streptomyces TaxID=2593676 RepID=UPI00145DCCDA|nr:MULTISPECIES: hypothetical protein [unclassified Streptomyces]NML54914.1 hypothetical protein [Streptomyces sp. R301]NML83601.1 hypothetical protein [Streptomyces sp. R302]
MEAQVAPQGAGGGDGIRGSWLRRRRGTVVAVTVGALALAGVGGWAAEVGPFAKDRYCWGAWEQDSGPRLLGDEELGRSGSERRAEESAAPSADRPEGTCTLRVTSSVPDSHGSSGGGGTIEFKKTVNVRYGAVPAAEEERLGWLREFLDGSVAPLPDGVPGLVGSSKGMVVLPESCDVDGRPTVVTVTGGETGDGHLGLVRMPVSIGSPGDVARLLLDVADEGMRRTGCAEGAGPLRVTSPVRPAREREIGGVDAKDTCGIRGLGFATGKGDHYEARPGAVADDVQLCTLTNTDNVRNPVFAGQFTMVAQPRLVALFQGLAGDRSPGPGWRGKGRLSGSYNIVQADCGKEPAVFMLVLGSGHLQKVAVPDVDGAFARAVNAVGDRIGCSDVAPRR